MDEVQKPMLVDMSKTHYHKDPSSFHDGDMVWRFHATFDSVRFLGEFPSNITLVSHLTGINKIFRRIHNSSGIHPITGLKTECEVYYSPRDKTVVKYNPGVGYLLYMYYV